MHIQNQLRTYFQSCIEYNPWHLDSERESLQVIQPVQCKFCLFFNTIIQGKAEIVSRKNDEWSGMWTFLKHLAFSPLSYKIFANVHFHCAKKYMPEG